MAATLQLNTRKNLVIAFAESSEGTDAVDAALEADSDIWYQTVAPPVWTTVRVPLPRDPARSHRQFMSAQSAPSHLGCVVNGEFTTGEQVATAGKDAPVWNMFLLAAGFSETLSSGVTATYTLDATTYMAGTPMTLWHLLGNSSDTKHRLKFGLGMRGNMVFSGGVGANVGWVWSGFAANFKAWSADAQYIDASDGTPLLGNDGAALSAGYAGTDLWNPAKKMRFATVTAQWNGGGTSVPIESFTIDPGLRPFIRQGAAASTVAENIYLDAPGPPTFTLKFAESDTAFDALIAARDADTVSDFVITWSDGSTKVTITFAAAQVDELRLSTDQNLAKWEVPFRAVATYAAAIPVADMTILFAAA